MGVFFVNEDHPKGGGTGHTIKVCELEGVPLATQSEWLEWIPE